MSTSEDAERVARNQGIIAEFRENGGTVEGFEGTPLLLLTTTGARSGEPRVSPVAHLADSDGFVVFAANGGRDRDPAWCTNLRADPHATVETPAGVVPVIARFAQGDERQALWDRGVAAMPMFGSFEASTDRVIPVVVLEPTSGSADAPSR